MVLADKLHKAAVCPPSALRPLRSAPQPFNPFSLQVLVLVGGTVSRRALLVPACFPLTRSNRRA
jgi:hypothetical protein